VEEEVGVGISWCLPLLHGHVEGVVEVIGLRARATRGSKEEGLLYGVGLAGEQLDEDAPSAPQVDSHAKLGGAEQEIERSVLEHDDVVVHGLPAIGVEDVARPKSEMKS
jgi:hypothetical protein